MRSPIAKAAVLMLGAAALVLALQLIHRLIG
jgi:hypothetical protein